MWSRIFPILFFFRIFNVLAQILCHAFPTQNRVLDQRAPPCVGCGARFGRKCLQTEPFFAPTGPQRDPKIPQPREVRIPLRCTRAVCRLHGSCKLCFLLGPCGWVSRLEAGRYLTTKHWHRKPVLLLAGTEPRTSKIPPAFALELV